MITLRINKKTHSVDVDPNMPLLWVLRDTLGMMGTKFGCGMALCGACTVHLNGTPIRSCVFPVASAQNNEITTIEGLSRNGEHPVQQAWIAEEVPSAATARLDSSCPLRPYWPRTPHHPTPI